MRPRKYVIFDIDGVLADPEHRLHHIRGGEKDWDAFFAAAKCDPPRRFEIELCNRLAEDHGIILLTGRSDVIKEDTVAWLTKQGVTYDYLMMRPHLDHRPDHEVKSNMLDFALAAEGADPTQIVAVFEDRKAVVDMWRERGFLVFQNTGEVF